MSALGGRIEDLFVKADSSSKVLVAGGIHNARVKGDYNSTVQLGDVSGVLRVNLDSSATAHVDGGSVDVLTLGGDYASAFVFDGTACEADISLDSSAQATIGRVTERLKLKGDYSSVTTIGGGNRTGVISRVDISLDSSAAAKVHATLEAGRIAVDYGASVEANAYGAAVRIRKDSGGRATTFS